MNLHDDNLLKDKHLLQALKHAPDNDLVPSETVRKKVLGYANKVNVANKPSQKPHGNWLAGLISNMKNWQWAGMSSVAVAVLAVLMLREQLPPEMTQPKVSQREAAPKVLAQNTAPAPEKALKEEHVDAAEYSAATPAAEPPRPVTGAQEKAKNNLPPEAPAAAPALADKDIEVVAAAPEVVLARPPPVATQSAPAAQELAKQDKTADAELRGRMESASADAAVTASTEQKEGDAKPKVAAKKSAVLEGAGALGVAKAQGSTKAKQDIQAGVLRILVAEWPVDKALVDEATGYSVEVVTGLVSEELAAYNQTMRDWHLQQH